MQFLLIGVPPICLVSEFRGFIIHTFPQMGVVLISKANSSNKIDKYDSVLRTFRFSPVLMFCVYIDFLKHIWFVWMNDIYILYILYIIYIYIYYIYTYLFIYLFRAPAAWVRHFALTLTTYSFIYLMKYFDIVRKPTHQTPLPPWAVPRRLQPECGSRTPFVAGCSVVPWQGADTVCIAYIISCINSSGICWMQNGICSVKTDIGILHRRFDDLLEGVFGSLWNKILLGEGQLQIHIYICIYIYMKHDET